MKILVINGGSSSLKFQVFQMPEKKVLIAGGFERIGDEKGFVDYKINGVKTTVNEFSKTHKDAVNVMVKILTKENIVKDATEIVAVGHRVVHGGPNYIKTTLVDDKVMKDFKDIIQYAPLHNPGAIMGVEGAKAIFNSVPHYLVFDTAFHQTLPPKAYHYGISLADAEKFGVRKYGFHGLSHKFVSTAASNMFGKGKTIVCHLGSGSSISAINENGECVDTSMGFTPLEGLMMCTRSGDIDPAAVLFLAQKKGMTHEEIVNYLTKESGFKGLYGSADMRDIMDNLDSDPVAKLAFDMFVYRIIKYVGSYAAVLNGVSNIIFTAGIGERDYKTREAICDSLNYLGVEIDKKINKELSRDGGQISSRKSKVNVAVIPTNEEVEIACEVYAKI